MDAKAESDSGRSNDDTPIPGSSFSPRGVRRLKQAIAVMTALFAVGFALAIYKVVETAGEIGTAGKDGPAAASPAVIDSASATGDASVRGARVGAGDASGFLSMALDGNRLAVLMRDAEGLFVQTIDTETGRTLSIARIVSAADLGQELSDKAGIEAQSDKPATLR